MATSVRVSGELVKEANIYSKVDKRSGIGKCAEQHPDRTHSLIKEILIGVAELDQGESSEYKFR